MRFLLALLLCLCAFPALANPDRWAREWPKTDFSQKSFEDWSEVVSGGPPRDGIPALTKPELVPVGTAEFSPVEPVITLELEGTRPRAYPVRYLLWHEIVNDVVGGTPVAVTFCPLCNSGMVFDRRTSEGVLEFGVTGKLRHSDMLMYDRQTESWWQQAQGLAIVGALTGAELKPLPGWTESWESFVARNPEGLVMAPPEGHRRDYGANPYVGYDSAERPFLYSGDPPPHDIAPLARVVRVADRAWPLERLEREGEIREAGVVLSWETGLASPLDTRDLAEGRDIGMVRVRDEGGRDVPHDVPFAFAFHALWPDGRWMLGD